MKKVKKAAPDIRDQSEKCSDIRSKGMKGSGKPGDRGACESETTTQGSE